MNIGDKVEVNVFDVDRLEEDWIPGVLLAFGEDKYMHECFIVQTENSGVKIVREDEIRRENRLTSRAVLSQLRETLEDRQILSWSMDKSQDALRYVESGYIFPRGSKITLEIEVR